MKCMFILKNRCFERFEWGGKKRNNKSDAFDVYVYMRSNSSSNRCQCLYVRMKRSQFKWLRIRSPFLFSWVSFAYAMCCFIVDFHHISLSHTQSATLFSKNELKKERPYIPSFIFLTYRDSMFDDTVCDVKLCFDVLQIEKRTHQIHLFFACLHWIQITNLSERKILLFLQLV